MAKKKKKSKGKLTLEWVCVRKCQFRGRVYQTGEPLWTYPVEASVSKGNPNGIPAHFKKRKDMEAEKEVIAKEKELARLKKEKKLNAEIKAVQDADVAKKVALQTEKDQEANRKEKD